MKFYSLLFFICMSMMISAQEFSEVTIDSDLTFEEAIKGTKAPKNVIDSLVLLDVLYYSTDDKLHKGQIVVHTSVAQDVKDIFKIIHQKKFPVAKVIPIVKYNWSDDASMKDNNSSAFCYRNIAGTDRLSNHALGKAVDINPFFNPVVYPDEHVSPKGAKYNPDKNGTFYQEQFIVQEFIKRGWRWGGTFNSYKDNHHFDKQ